MKKSLVKPEITSAAIYRCTAKCDTVINNHRVKAGEKFYVVKSDSGNGYYAIIWDAFLQRFICGCLASTHDCKHVRGMQEVLEIRKQRLAEIAKSKQEHITPAAALAGYDVVGESLKLVNQAMADAKIGSHYEQVGAMYQQQQSEVLWSNVCHHRVKFDVNSHCGCMA